jgi:hypothetical protein
LKVYDIQCFTFAFLKALRGKWSFQSLSRLCKQKGPIFENCEGEVKIHWISMMSPTKNVMSKYKILLMKMAINIPNNEKVKHGNKI